MTITVTARSRHDPVWIGDGIRLAAVGWMQGRLYLVVTTRREARVTCPGRRIRHAFAPDGRRQAVFWLADGEAFRIDALEVRIARVGEVARGVASLQDLSVSIAALGVLEAGAVEKGTVEANAIQVYRERRDGRRIAAAVAGIAEVIDPMRVRACGR